MRTEFKLAEKVLKLVEEREARNTMRTILAAREVSKAQDLRARLGIPLAVEKKG